jgi:alkylhydroperoxidase family enzyme
LEDLKRRYGDQVEFLAIYVREAHPTDGWRMNSNDQAGISIQQPRNEGERVDVARRCCSSLNISMPLVVDEMDDRVGHAYSGMPDRLYLIDRKGRIAYKGGRGPFGFKPGELEQSLLMLLLDQEPAVKSPERLSMLTNEEAWKRLPGAPEKVHPLPAWARMFAGPLPLTTARMLELDALHRSGDRLEPRLRGLVRWAAADANRCDYAKNVAVADLRRAGITAAELRTLLIDPNRLSAAERAAVAFARKMMREAHAVTDEEMKQLLGFYGEERVVALVALLAHASFQDRIFLAANVRAEPGESLPPLTVQFAKPPAKPSHGTSPVAAKAAQSTAGEIGDGGSGEWIALQEGVNRQKARPGRIRVPSKEEVRKRLGDGHPGLWQADINWARVCYGNQPELTDAWFACAAAFRQEAGFDSIFQLSLFWIVTRSLQCFY